MPRMKDSADSIASVALDGDDEPTQNSKPNYSVPAVEKVLDIIEYLAAEGVPMTCAQLARALNRQPPELFRMLTCLESRGSLRDSGSNAYALMLKLFELSRTHSPYEGLLRVAEPHMRARGRIARIAASVDAARASGNGDRASGESEAVPAVRRSGIAACVREHDFGTRAARQSER